VNSELTDQLELLKAWHGDNQKRPHLNDHGHNCCSIISKYGLYSVRTREQKECWLIFCYSILSSILIDCFKIDDHISSTIPLCCNWSRHSKDRKVIPKRKIETQGFRVNDTTSKRISVNAMLQHMCIRLLDRARQVPIDEVIQVSVSQEIWNAKAIWVPTGASDVYPRQTASKSLPCRSLTSPSYHRVRSHISSQISNGEVFSSFSIRQ
jgi:hypothetical protein